MKNIKFPKLNNPPIKEVILGLMINELFNSEKERELLCDKFKDLYPNKETINSFSVQLQDKPQITESLENGIILSKADKSEQIHIMPNKLMYVDRNKYKTFDIFYNRYKTILSEVLATFKEFEVYDIGLRYVNNFTLPITNMMDYFLIAPNINCDYNSNHYADIAGYLSAVNIASSVDRSIQGNVKTAIKAINVSQLNITFDIDTHKIQTCTISNLDNFKEQLLQLKEFKNSIFYSNIKKDKFEEIL